MKTEIQSEVKGIKRRVNSIIAMFIIKEDKRRDQWSVLPEGWSLDDIMSRFQVSESDFIAQFDAWINHWKN